MQTFKEYVNILERKLNTNKKEIIFVCIGTTEIIWDSVGPIVGSYLKANIGEKKVLGDIDNNICSKKDLIHYMPKLNKKFIVAIDSALSNTNLDGEIFISNRPIIMGKGLNLNKGIIGDLSIKASISDVEKVDREYIKNIASTIARGICYIIKKND